MNRTAVRKPSHMAKGRRPRPARDRGAGIGGDARTKLTAVAVLALVVAGTALVLPIWGSGFLRFLAVIVGVAALLFGINVGLAAIVRLRSEAARKYLVQLRRHMSESASAYYRERHSWCKRDGRRHEVVATEEVPGLWGVRIDGRRLKRHYLDWGKAFEDAAVHVLTDRC